MGKHKTTVTEEQKTVKKKCISDSALEEQNKPAACFEPPETLGYGKTKIRKAQTARLYDAGVMQVLSSKYYQNIGEFLGYGALAKLSQDGVIKRGVEMRSDEMTRRWIELQYREGAEGADERINDIVADMTALHVDKIVREAVEMCGYYGGCLVYIDVGDISSEEMRLPLGGDKDTFALDSIRSLKIIEPFNIAAGRYSCYSPLDKDYFVPQTWLINGREVHASRFLYFAENKPPTLLLPAYNFFGIPLAQTVLDSVMGFTQTSKAAARMMTKYSCTVFKTDMNDVLSGGMGVDLRRRIEYFAKNRDNDGIMAIDIGGEEILSADHSLSGVTDIVRQQMEIVSAMFGEPAVKLWGISPNGFNSTGDSDMKNHYDSMHATQERIMRDPLEYLIKLLQLNRYGDFDENLTFEFVPLSDEDSKLKAEIQSLNVNAMGALFDRGIISGSEARHKLASDPESGYNDIDESEEIESPDDLALPFEGELTNGEENA